MKVLGIDEDKSVLKTLTIIYSHIYLYKLADIFFVRLFQKFHHKVSIYYNAHYIDTTYSTCN